MYIEYEQHYSPYRTCAIRTCERHPEAVIHRQESGVETEDGHLKEDGDRRSWRCGTCRGDNNAIE